MLWKIGRRELEGRRKEGTWDGSVRGVDLEVEGVRYIEMHHGPASFKGQISRTRRLCNEPLEGRRKEGTWDGSVCNEHLSRLKLSDLTMSSRGGL